MMSTILQILSTAFPYTCARLAHWHLLLSYDDTGLLDPQNMTLAILPSCIYYIHGIAAARNVHNDDDDDEPWEDRPGPFRAISHCLRYWFFVYKAFDLVAALDVVLRAPGFWGKALLAMDLLVECTLVLVAKVIFIVSVGLFVGAALGGFPFLEAFFTSLWMFVQLEIEEFREELFERNDLPADEAFREE